MEKIKKYSFVILILVTFSFILFNYYHVIIAPNDYLFTTYGDGIKNYFTYASHIKESSVVDSHIMNYPYGENYLYLDCQPILTVVLQKLSNVFPGIVNYSISIINYIMILSILFSAIFIYLIFVQLKVDRLISVLAAFSIAVLAPQIHRITGHLALSYSFFIPMAWYFYLKLFNSDKKIIWAIILCLTNLMWYFVHGYLGMILSSFFLLCFVFDFLLYKRKKGVKLNYWLSFGIAVILPLIAFWLYATLLDSHVGRTKDPWGFFATGANLSSVFLPTHPPLNNFFNMLCPLNQRWEGWAYVGIGTTLLCILFLVNGLLNLMKRKDVIFDSSLLFKNKFLVVSLCASIILLLFSFMLPFKWGLHFLLDWFKVIKNFRAVGRFAWVFYYVATVSSVYFIYQLYSKKRTKTLLILVLLLPLSYFCEGISYHLRFKPEIIQTPNLFCEKNLNESMQNCLKFADSSKYQAIIPLPFYHIGSENYGKEAPNKIYEYSMILAYHSNLPLVGNYSTRTSIWETKNIMQIFSEDFYYKKIQDDMKSNKSFLVLYSNDPLLEYENKLLEKCEFLYSDDNCSLYSIRKEELFRDSSKEEINKFENIKTHLYEKGGFLISSEDPEASLIYKSYDNLLEEITFSGQGALKGNFKNNTNLFEIESNKLKENTDYILNIWMYNEGKNFGQDALRSNLLVETENDGNVESIAQVNPVHSIIINNAWSLIELPFSFSSKPQKMAVYLKGGGPFQEAFYVDELLIREEGVDVYKVLESENGEIKSLFKNNHIIKIDK